VAHPPGVFVDKDGSVDALAAGLIRRTRLKQDGGYPRDEEKRQREDLQKMHRVQDSGDDSTCTCRKRWKERQRPGGSSQGRLVIR
jgi:hypothetical protein